MEGKNVPVAYQYVLDNQRLARKTPGSLVIPETRRLAVCARKISVLRTVGYPKVEKLSA
jgi:hypothetical protein